MNIKDFELINECIKTVCSLGTLLGLFLFQTYYWSIDHTPMFDAGNLIFFAGYSSLIGIFILAGILFILFMPFIMWICFFREREVKQLLEIARFKHVNPFLFRTLNMVCPCLIAILGLIIIEKYNQRQIVQSIVAISLSLITFLALNYKLIPKSWSLIKEQGIIGFFKKYSFAGFQYYSGILMSSFSTCGIFLFCTLMYEKQLIENYHRFLPSWAIAVFIAILSVFFNQLLMLFKGDEFNAKKKTEKNVTVFQKIMPYGVILFFMTLSLSILTDNFAWLPKIIFKKQTWGYYTDASVMIDNKRHLYDDLEDFFDKDQIELKEPYLVVKDVFIFNRIGSEILIAKDKYSKKYIIQKEDFH